MKKNLGIIDRVLRFVFGIVLFYFGIFYFENIILRIVLVVFGVGSFIEGFAAYCPLYRWLGINICGGKK